MTRVAWFHCFSGIAGDMALGSLVDAGADLGEVRDVLGRLPVGGWSIEAEPVLRCGVAATKVHVRAQETSVVRTAAHIAALVEEARLPERVRRRALAVFNALAAADAIVVVAGMEGALASLVGGLTAVPVVAVPTSVGYGAGLEGITALLGMLASCAAGITVVGIDNGYGAACAVLRTLK